MVLTAIVSLLAALGLVLLVWCLTGAWLLPSGGSGYSVRFPDGSEESWRSVRAGLFLLRSGLSRQTLFLVDCGLSEAQRRQLAQLCADSPSVRLLTPEEWDEYQERERQFRVSGP